MLPRSPRGAPREALGVVLEHLVAKKAPKIAKRSPRRRQDGQLDAKMGQHGAQEAAKCSQDGDLGSMLGACGIDFRSFWMLFGCQAAYQKTFSFSTFFDIKPDIQKASKIIENRSRKLPTWSQDLHLDCICRPLGLHLGPSWRHVGYLGASWGSSWRSWAPSWSQDVPKRLREALRPPRTSIFNDFGTSFQRIWDLFFRFSF